METIEHIFLVLACVAAFGLLIGGLDDLFFDSQFLAFLWRNRRKPPISLQDLKLAPEQWIALFVPAWQEGGVVNKMAEYTARVLLYEKYDLFIGVYPNDPETNKCVTELCAVNPRVHKVLVPHPGPTNKADCLNWIYRAMKSREIPGVREYKIIALHGAEDILHPLVLKVYNYYVAREYDMARLPVFALEWPVWKFWAANTYVDDCSELHTKDLFIRQSMGGVIPSAGVGTAFARALLDQLAAGHQGEPFLASSLTEDYEVGIRAQRAGYRTGVVSYPVERAVRRKRKDGKLGEAETVSEVVAIREPFPKSFRAAVRQRSRWILGISFQNWEQAGWAGTLPMRYTLLRDRGAPLTHLINMTGYLVLGYLLLHWLLKLTWPAAVHLRPLFNPDSLLWKVALADSLFLAYRAAQRMISVASIYNLKQALFSLPRAIVGHFINFAATLRATRLYLGHKFLNQSVLWHTTPHVFPGEAELSEYTRTIEDLLVEEGLATREQITDALNMVRAGSAPLCLLRLGLLDEQHFTEIWSRHSRLKVEWIHPCEVQPSLLRRFPEAQSLELDALPLEEKDQQVVMAFLEPPTLERLTALGQQLGAPVHAVLARPSNLALARDRAYASLVLPSRCQGVHLQRFQQAARLDSRRFLEVISHQHASAQSLPDVMINLGHITEPQGRRVWAEVLGCQAADSAEFELNEELYHEIGPAFWWFHRMLPITWDLLATATEPHPLMMEWLAHRMAAKADFVSELPSKIELSVDLDPDQLLLDCLVRKGLLPPEQLPKLQSMRAVLADPLPKWLGLQKLVTPEQLHEAFLEIAHLPMAEPWTAEEVRQLRPVLPPGFAQEHGCHVLQEVLGNVRIGLAQMPSREILRQIHARLSGYPIFFQALSRDEAVALGAMDAAEGGENLSLPPAECA